MEPHDQEALSNVIRAMQRFAQFDIKMQLSTALTLLYIAKFQDKEGGVSTTDIQNWVGMTSATASRNQHYWAKGTNDMPSGGFGCITVEHDPMDMRKKIVRLSPKGEAFIRSLTEGLQ